MQLAYNINNMFSIKNILRIVHGIITVFFGLCIIQIYYSFFTYTRSILLYGALIAVYAEAFVVFVLNRGNCPMSYIHRKFGDDKYFFELFFPNEIAKKVIPIVAVIAFIGTVLLFLQEVGLL